MGWNRRNRFHHESGSQVGSCLDDPFFLPFPFVLLLSVLLALFGLFELFVDFGDLLTFKLLLFFELFDDGLLLGVGLLVGVGVRPSDDFDFDGTFNFGVFGSGRLFNFAFSFASNLLFDFKDRGDFEDFNDFGDFEDFIDFGDFEAFIDFVDFVDRKGNETTSPVVLD